MARQFLNPAPVLHDVLGIDPAFNGSLTFYEVGTTTEKDTWSRYQQGDAYLNPNPIPLDSAARSSVQIWGEGDYTVVLKDADGETVWTRDWRPEQAGSDELPAKESGKFLTTDGENWLLDDVRQVPDPTGYSGRVLSNDGANAIWMTAASLVSGLIPDAPEIDVDIQANRAVIGDGVSSTKLLIQWGTGTATGGGGGVYLINATVAFPVAYGALWWVGLTPNTAAVNAGDSGRLPATSVTGWTPGSGASSITANFATTEDDRSGGSNIQNPIPFGWIAIGTYTAP